MTQTEALKHLKEVTEVFGPDEGVEFGQKAWSAFHTAIKEALALSESSTKCEETSHAQPEQEPVATSDTLQERVDETAKQRHEQEPFCWAQCTSAGLYVSNEPDEYYTMPLYTTPPQRKPLLASDIVTMYDENPRSDSEMIEFARAIEAAHGITGEQK